MVTTRNDTHGAPAPICEDRPRARIFVCDDDDDMRALLADALRSDGYEVLEARDGAETLELV